MKNILHNVVSEVFPDMYFLFPRPVDECEGAESGEHVCVVDISPQDRSTASANPQGQMDPMAIFLSASTGAASAMARNMLGEDRSFEPRDLSDVMCEAANVIAGNFVNKVPALSGATLSVPATDSRVARDRTHGQVLAYDVHGDPFFVTLVCGSQDKRN